MNENKEQEALKRKFKISSEELVSFVAAFQERCFCEELSLLENVQGFLYDKIAEVFLEEALSTNYKKGIDSTEDDLRDRDIVFGSNKKAPVATKTLMELIWTALEDFTLRILVFASFTSMIIEMATSPDNLSLAWVDGFAILVAVIVCVLVSALNDYQKEKQFQKLNKVSDLRKTLTVIRNGAPANLHQDDIMVGDLVKIYEGMEIPADGFIIEAAELSTDESAMTGESELIKKNTLKECLKRRDIILAEGSKNISTSHDVPSPILLSGTRVFSGEGFFVVIVVGPNSCVGRIKSILGANVTEITPLQEKLEAIARDIGKFGLIAAIFIFSILILRFTIDRITEGGFDHSKHWVELLHFFIIAIAIIVLAIPEGLPLSVTISLAFSVKRMLADNNLVRKLQACETMGGANIICSDKTGTLTQNKMTLTCIWNKKRKDIDTYSAKTTISDVLPQPMHEILIQSFAINNSALLVPEPKGSKTDIAILEFLERTCVDFNKTQREAVYIKKIPFNASRKQMTTIVGQNDSEDYLLLTKGASEIILESCTQMMNRDGSITPLSTGERGEIENSIQSMANSALRTIIVAFKYVSKSEDLDALANPNQNNGIFSVERNNLVFFLLLGIKDILRKEVPKAVEMCKKAGIRVKMVTGDNKYTAQAIARECNIIEEGRDSIVMEGVEFMDLVGGVVCKKCRTKKCNCPLTREEAATLGKEIRVDTIANPEAFDKIYPNLDVLARSRPDDKYALVLGLVERSNVVAVTGDGTNDALALKKADVGFAMGISGTEMAREAADIILVDDNFKSIVKAVIWGRNIYDSIKKFLQFQLTVNMVAVISTIITAAVMKQEILSPVQMLWVNLIMDSLASLALATEPPSLALLNRAPHKRNEYIISKVFYFPY